jgi:hypothetical protein
MYKKESKTNMLEQNEKEDNSRDEVKEIDEQETKKMKYDEDNSPQVERERGKRRLSEKNERKLGFCKHLVFIYGSDSDIKNNIN